PFADSGASSRLFEFVTAVAEPGVWSTLALTVNVTPGWVDDRKMVRKSIGRVKLGVGLKPSAAVGVAPKPRKARAPGLGTVMPNVLPVGCGVGVDGWMWQPLPTPDGQWCSTMSHFTSLPPMGYGWSAVL